MFRLTVAFQNGPSLSQQIDTDCGTALMVPGTAGNDTMVFAPNGSTGAIDATFNSLPKGTFHPTGDLSTFESQHAQDID